MLKGGHSVWSPSGFGAWLETALAPPGDLRAFSPEAVVLLLDGRFGRFDLSDLEAAAAHLTLAFPDAAILPVDLNALAEATPGFYDERMWRLAAMPWSLKALRAIAAEIEQLLAVAKLGGKKVLAVDFDNTLWRGVVGEDGAQGIEPRADFQRRLKRLKERGVLLVGLSKNNPDDVAGVWTREDMVLKATDFAAMRVNWAPKAGNLLECAQELDLGSDSFVFVDDNPAERARMRLALGEVAVPSFPATEAEFAAFAWRLEQLYFARSGRTAEDLARSAHYQAEAKRRALADGRTLGDYLEALGIWTKVRFAQAGDFERIAQLAQKTNQFNVSGNRYTLGEVEAIAGAPDRLLFVASAGDKFGDLGLIAFVQVALAGPRAEIVDWVMSCRAMNRRIEFAVESFVEADLAARGVTSLAASYRPTPKNAPVAQLFDGFGFASLDNAAPVRTYRKELARGA